MGNTGIELLFSKFCDKTLKEMTRDLRGDFYWCLKRAKEKDELSKHLTYNDTIAFLVLRQMDLVHIDKDKKVELTEIGEATYGSLVEAGAYKKEEK